MITLHTLGCTRIDVDTEAECTRLTPAAGKRFALLLYLATQPGCRAARTAAQDLLFPASKQGRHGLRELLYQLRRSGVIVGGDAHTIEVGPVRADWMDITQAGRPTPEILRSAQGGVLPGYRPLHGPAFGEWYERFRSATAEALCRRALSEAARALADNDFAGAEAAARAAVALAPGNNQVAVTLAHLLERIAT